MGVGCFVIGLLCFFLLIMAYLHVTGVEREMLFLQYENEHLKRIIQNQKDLAAAEIARLETDIQSLLAKLG